MAKAIAVPYVIALILGIIVVAVIGYWFFVIVGGGGGAALETQCRAKFFAFCSNLAATGQLDEASVSAFGRTQDTDCASVASKVSSFGATAAGCNEVLGSLGGQCVPNNVESCSLGTDEQGNPVTGTRTCQANGIWGTCQ